MIKIKLLWCSDSVLLPTGYAQVTRNVLGNLSKVFETHHMGFQYKGMSMSHGIMHGRPLPYTIHPTAFNNEGYGEKGSLQGLVRSLKPDVCMYLCDSFMIGWLTANNMGMFNDPGNGPKLVKEWFNKMGLEASEEDCKKAWQAGRELTRSITTIKRESPNTRFGFYFPFDSADVYEGAGEVLGGMDLRVAMSQFAQKLLKDETGLDSFYIPHGVDTHIYRPLPRQVVDAWKKQNGLENVFIVGTVNRNQSRKMLPYLLEAFAGFAEGKDDVRLFMHCDPNDPMGHNLHDFSERLGITDKVVYSGMTSFISGLQESAVNLFYNVMDVYANPTTGEGFGLPTIEAMAAGTPVVITDYTTSEELVQDDGWRIPVDGFLPGQKNTKRAIVDVDDMAAAFEEAYNSPELVQAKGVSGRERVLDEYNWEKVNRAWIELFETGKVTEYPQ